MDCPYCQSQQVTKRGFDSLQDDTLVQRRCKDCCKRFNERTGTPMARLRTSSTVISYAINAWTEGMGARAAGRTFGKSHTTSLRWEQRLTEQVENWSPPAPEDSDVTIESDEVYTRVGENLPPPSQSQGWTIYFTERESRYWVTAHAEIKDKYLFPNDVQATWEWVNVCDGIRWFTDGERRYGQELWKLASVYLKAGDYHPDYGHRKVWREGLEVAMKVKRAQGTRRIEWVKIEHPFTAISPDSEVHANRNETQNAVLRRHCSTYRRRQNLDAKKLSGLQRVLDVQRLIHNWVRPHWGLRQQTTLAMEMGFCSRPLSTLELLNSRGFKHMSC